MTNDFKEKGQPLSENDSLEELLADVTDEQEREKLTRAWHAFGGLSDKEYSPPEPSAELERVFRGVNEEMSDEELGMLAAAGTPGQPIIGDDNANYLLGTGEGEEIEGRGGNDIIFGNAGDDTIDGGTGDDRISGGLGNDRITGGEGNDIMSGGAGGDVFVFDNNGGHDTITDFNPLEDRFDFQNVDPDSITMTFENGNTIITYGENGENSITVQGVNLLEDTDSSDGTYW